MIKNSSSLTPVKINLEFSSLNSSLNKVVSLANLLINRYNDPIRNLKHWSMARHEQSSVSAINGTAIEFTEFSEFYKSNDT